MELLTQGILIFKLFGSARLRMFGWTLSVLHCTTTEPDCKAAITALSHGATLHPKRVT